MRCRDRGRGARGRAESELSRRYERGRTEEEREPPERLAAVAEGALGGARAAARHAVLRHLVEQVVEAVEHRLAERHDQPDVEQVEHRRRLCRRRLCCGRVARERRAARQVDGHDERRGRRRRRRTRSRGHCEASARRRLRAKIERSASPVNSSSSARELLNGETVRVAQQISK